MAGNSLKVQLITPRGVITADSTDAVLAPGRLGQFEILAGHVPFLAELHAGVITLGESVQKKYFAIGPGVLEVTSGGDVQILCERAKASADIDMDTSMAEMSIQQEKLSVWSGPQNAEYRTMKSQHDWAQAQIDTLQISDR